MCMRKQTNRRKNPRAERTAIKEGRVRGMSEEQIKRKGGEGKKIGKDGKRGVDICIFPLWLADGREQGGQIDQSKSTEGLLTVEKNSNWSASAFFFVYFAHASVENPSKCSKLTNES